MLKTLSATLVALVVSADLCAQGAQIPMPAFGRTFSASSLTRGYWFQAPIPFVITGLQVPDETANGTQNVEVFIMPSAPPTWPTLGNGGSVFYQANVPSAQVVQTGGIFVNAGDYVGILGACGTTTMHNSYAASGAQPSSVLGQPITLTRFLTQTSLNTSGGDQPYSTELNGPIARIDCFVAPAAGFAFASPFENGCNGLAIGSGNNTRPLIGQQYEFEVSSIPANTAIGAILIGGLQFVPGIDLSALGAPGCALYTSGEFALPFPATGASQIVPFAIPPGAPPGLSVYAQAATVTPGLGMSGLSSSNGLQMVIDIN